MRKKNETAFNNATNDVDRLKYFKRIAHSKVGPSYYDDIKRSLDEMGIQYVHAPREADSQLVYLFRTGEIAGIMGNDGDYILQDCVVIDVKFYRYYSPEWDWGDHTGPVLAPRAGTDDAAPDFEESDECRDQAEALADRADENDQISQEEGHDGEGSVEFQRDLAYFLSVCKETRKKVAENFIKCRSKSYLLHVAAVVGCDYSKGEQGWGLVKALDLFANEIRAIIILLVY